MILRLLLRAFKRHLKCFYDDFDPIKDITLDHQNLATSRLAHGSRNTMEQFLPPELSSRSKGHYLFGLATIFYIAGDTLLILVRNGVILSSLTNRTREVERVANIPELFTHRIFPRTFWSQADIIAFVCLVMAALLYGLLWWRPLMLDVSVGRACLFALRDSASGEVVRLVDFGGEGKRLLMVMMIKDLQSRSFQRRTKAKF